MNFHGSARRRPEAALEMTPLIDVVFLLLVFFLLTTTFSQPTPTESTDEPEEAVIDVDLPSASSGNAETSSESLTVYLDPDGRVYLDSDTPLAPNELKATLLQKRDEGTDVIVNLKADKQASHGATMELLDLVKQSGVQTVNFVIEKPQ